MEVPQLVDKLTGNKNVILSDPIWGMDGKLTFNLRPKLTSKACTLCTDERSGRAQASLYGAHDFSSTGFLKQSPIVNAKRGRRRRC